MVFIHYRVKNDDSRLSLHCDMPPSFEFIANWNRRRELTVKGISLIYIDFKNDGGEPLIIEYDQGTTLVDTSKERLLREFKTVIDHKMQPYDELA